MGDVRPHNPSQPTSYISQDTPLEVHIGAGGSLLIRNKQPFLLYRGGELRTHKGDLANVQPSDRVCFCPRRFTGRHYATFLFRLTPDGSDTEEEEEEQEQEEEEQEEEHDLEDFEVQVTSGWRTKKRKLPCTIPAASTSGDRRCGKCGKPGHNRRTCLRRM